MLRAASVHRILRGAAAGLLAELGGLLVVAGGALRSVSAGTESGVGDRVTVVGAHPALAALGTAGALVGGLVLLAGLVLLVLPAPRLRPAPSGPPPAPVPAVPA